MMLQKQNRWKLSVCSPQFILGSSKPDVIFDYNKAIVGVDLLSRVLIPYFTQRRRVKWYKKIGKLILDILIYNSFIVYQKLDPGNGIKDHLRYQMKLIEKILTHHLFLLHHTKLIQPHQTCCVSLRVILFLKSPLHLAMPKEDVFAAQNLGQGEILVFGAEDMGSVCPYQIVLKFTTHKKTLPGSWKMTEKMISYFFLILFKVYLSFSFYLWFKDLVTYIWGNR